VLDTRIYQEELWMWVNRELILLVRRWS